MRPWFQTLDDRVWLRPDKGGEHEASFVKRALGLEEGHSVLDAPCGAGRVALPLAREGLSVTGLDIRESFIRRGLAQAEREGLKVDLRVADLRQASIPDGEYHGIFCWFNSFGYFSERENFDLLCRYATGLRRGGRLLIDQLNRERILRDFKKEREDSGIIYTSRWDARSGRLHTRRIVEGVEDPANRSSQRLYTPGEIARLLRQSGLHVESIYASMSADAYKRDGPQMIVVARKP